MDRAAADWTETKRLGDHFFAEGFFAKAAAFYKKALRLNPADEQSLMQLGDIAARQGLLADAKAYFRQLAEQRRARGDQRGLAECLVRLAAILKDAATTLEKQGRKREALEALQAAARLDPDDVDLWLRLSRLEIENGRDARDAILRVLALAPQRHREVLPLCEWLAAAGLTGSAYACLEALTDLALLDGDVDGAVAGLRAFLEHGEHAAAVEKLAALQPRALPAEAGSHVETARTLPAEAGSHVETAPDAGSAPAPEASDPTTPVASDPTTAQASGPAPPVASGSVISVASGFSRKDDDALEIDLSELLAGLEEAPAPARPPDLEQVFEDIRARVGQGQQASGAMEQYQRGLDRLLGGDTDGARADLQAVARVPLFRFPACAQLGRLLLEQGALAEAVEWLERAAEAPAPAPEDGHALMYELADALERLGESARALAVLLELEADAGAYRDVRARLEQLTRAQA